MHIWVGSGLSKLILTTAGHEWVAYSALIGLNKVCQSVAQNVAERMELSGHFGLQRQRCSSSVEERIAAPSPHIRGRSCSEESEQMAAEGCSRGGRGAMEAVCTQWFEAAQHCAVLHSLV